MVSLETAATLIQEERNNDDGDYIEGGIDIGRTAASLIAEVLPQPEPIPLPRLTFLVFSPWAFFKSKLYIISPLRLFNLN